ncbi:MAG TPA: hypothetical protein DCE41_27850 [Cytophagales bacterium]|nr:hypothetical protein [Cytophagales bacterium]HAP63834.1 hypothetical protein [Cytophagales bacterium]
MSKYLYLFRGGDGRMSELSPEESQAHMARWGAWMGALAQEGKLLSGDPLQSQGKVVEQAGAIIHDGPFAEGKEMVGGYLMINADTLDGAVELSKECPIFELGGTVEVREILPFQQP